MPIHKIFLTHVCTCVFMYAFHTKDKYVFSFKLQYSKTIPTITVDASGDNIWKENMREK